MPEQSKLTLPGAYSTDEEFNAYRQAVVGACLTRLHAAYGTDRSTYPAAVSDEEFRLIALTPTFGEDEVEALRQSLDRPLTLTPMPTYAPTPRQHAGPRGPRRDAPAPQPGQQADRTPPATKPPSFLAQVKAALHDLTHTWEEDAERADDFAGELWNVVQPAVVQSYWNGVSAGASGRVKPKPRRER